MGFFEKLKKDADNRIRKSANDAYQITEHNGELWFTFNGFLFCPCSMMTKSPIEALEELRENYIRRHTAASIQDNKE